MKSYIITIEQIEESPEGDNRQFAYEEHQLILNDDEQFLGVCMVYKGSKPKEIDQES